MGKFIFFSVILLMTALTWTWFQYHHLHNKPKTAYKKGQYIDRLSTEPYVSITEPQHSTPPSYKWSQHEQHTPYPVITKDFFRCKGSILHPLKTVEQNGGEPMRLFDCGGAEKHSLPLRDGKEFIYPILIDLLNHVQTKTHKKVVITSGHRCPQHHSYCYPLKNRHSKHQIGAEVDFYVKGMEYSPEQVVRLLTDYFSSSESYQGYPEYITFKRGEMEEGGNHILPWYNKEIFIKIYDVEEGRDFDNQHPYPYISIQVRYDREKKESVAYSWPLANKTFHRF